MARARPGFRLVHYSLQGNHAHLIVEAVDRDALGRGMMALASRLARAVNRFARRTGSVLADCYHVRLLRLPLNARRHAATLGGTFAQAVRLDPASSARWFDGWKPNTLVTEHVREAQPVAAPVARAPIANTQPSASEQTTPTHGTPGRHRREVRRSFDARQIQKDQDQRPDEDPGHLRDHVPPAATDPPAPASARSRGRAS